MHKEEASKLFLCLGDGVRVKIVKMLYHNNKLTLEQLCERMDMMPIELKIHLDILCDSGLVLRNDIEYVCDKALVDNLMAFIPTKCGCCS